LISLVTFCIKAESNARLRFRVASAEQSRRGQKLENELKLNTNTTAGNIKK
jgi:hypothetical protein